MDSAKRFAIAFATTIIRDRSRLASCTKSSKIRRPRNENSIRVIDESGEGYFYPEAWFVRVNLPEIVEARLLATR